MDIENGSSYIVKWNKKALKECNFSDRGNFIIEVCSDKQMLLIGQDEPFWLCDVEIIKKIDMEGVKECVTNTK